MKPITKYLVAVIVIVAIGGIFSLARQGKDSSANKTLIPVETISHGHGLAVDIADPNKLYIATHYGLFVLVNEKDLYQIGKNKDDYMGFSPHPTNPDILYSSGHPVTHDRNAGFQESDDGGFTWKKISNGAGGDTVDFHAMTVSPANPSLVYGWYKGQIQRSLDGGKNWEAFDTNFVVVYLAADPKNENVVYAATPQGDGVMVSRDKGQTWSVLSPQLGRFVSVVVMNPQNSQQLLSFSERLGLAKSVDEGVNWQTVKGDFQGATVLFIAFSKQSPNIVYALTHENTIYKSADSGDSWNKIR